MGVHENLYTLSQFVILYVFVLFQIYLVWNNCQIETKFEEKGIYPALQPEKQERC